MSHEILVNTAHTLSIHSHPGEDKLFPNTSIQSIFTFGDFRIHRDLTSNSLTANTNSVSFGGFGTLSSMSGNSESFDAVEVSSLNENELNIRRNDPNSYSYFGSFYTKVATAVNNIIENFPYAILVNDNFTGNTIVNYINNYNGTSSFSIPITSAINQGNIIYASGVTQSTASPITLFNDYQSFGIELSSSTLHQTVLEIQNYSYIPSSQTINVTVNGTIFSGNTSASTIPIYISPTKHRYFQYKNSLSDLEYQILFEQQLLVPNPETDVYERQSFVWPKTIDGFNPDASGVDFESYLESILNCATSIDDTRTNWMIRTMIPENYLELDSESSAYRRLVSVYADEFDKIKKYIDNLAYSHSVTYNNQESIPDKFLHKLSSLLGWEPINEFSETDIFEYLAREDENGFTKENYNNDLWKKILININWLYKKKGTRDALQFIFKLMGAPDCLIHFNEFVYTIRQSSTGSTVSNFSSKVNSDGYIDYNSSRYAFQEGGIGRGNGDAYINQWTPEFNPIRTVNNIKVQTGSTEFFGTANLVNTKEVEIDLSPAAAIECDVNEWFNLSLVSGSTTNVQAGIPSYIDLNNVRTLIPNSITGMTMAQWLDHVYINCTDPRSRKTEGFNTNRHVFYYKHLKDIYLAYYFWNYNNHASNRLNFEKLEKFLILIQRNFTEYIYRLLPATTIIDRDGALYRNTLFNRQKFVYPPGINDGSEFQIPVPLSPDLDVNAVVVTSRVNDNISSVIDGFHIVSEVPQNLTSSISAVQVLTETDTGINESINAVSVSSELLETSVRNSVVTPNITGIISIFPIEGIPQAQPPTQPVTYRTRTNVVIITSGNDQQA